MKRRCVYNMLLKSTDKSKKKVICYLAGYEDNFRADRGRDSAQ